MCPKTGAAHRLIQRPDDNERTVKERLRVYDEKTRPLIEHYAEQGLLHRIAGTGELDAVTERLEAALRSALQAAPERRALPRAAQRGSTTSSRGAKKSARGRTTVVRSRKPKTKSKKVVKARRAPLKARRAARPASRKRRTARRATPRRRG